MDCQNAKQMLEPCAKGLLSAADKAELDRHVVTCEGCRLELELTRAVLGSSSSSSESVDDPALVDPLMAADDRSAFDETVGPELTIEQERLPEPLPEGPGPPRVLTSQLPEEPEEALDLATLEPTAYDPGAIHLPHPEQPFESTARQDAPPEPTSSPAFDDDVSFADLAADAPTLETAPTTSGTPAPSLAAAGAGSKGAAGSKSWDFEPVDVPRASAPPEESLTFAKEALDRKRGNATRGQHRAKVLLWVGGALGGVGLLGASVWMALAFREPTVTPEPTTIPAVQPPPVGDPIPPATTDSIAPTDGPAPGLTRADSAAAPGPGSVLKAGAVTSAGTGAMPVIPGAKPSVATRPSTTKPVAGAPSTASAGVPVSSKTSDASAKDSKPAASPSPAPAAAFRDDELAPAPRREPKILTVEPDAKPGDPGYVPFEEETPAPPASTKPVITAPIFVPPSSGTPKSGSGSTGGSAPAASGPLDRLHTATVTAEKNADLETLRKLKESWKTAVRTSTAEDRTRSKREYADCLWAIQEITKRHADRKEALAAYREYVLHAPAGGADARTVSRMRHLEDILSDAQ